MFKLWKKLLLCWGFIKLLVKEFCLVEEKIVVIRDKLYNVQVNMDFEMNDVMLDQRKNKDQLIWGSGLKFLKRFISRNFMISGYKQEIIILGIFFVYEGQIFF